MSNPSTPPTDQNPNELRFSTHSLEQDLKAQPGQTGSISIPPITPTTPITLPPLVDLPDQPTNPPSSPAADFSNPDLVAPPLSAWSTPSAIDNKNLSSIDQIVALEKKAWPLPRLLLIGAGVLVVLAGGLFWSLSNRTTSLPRLADQPSKQVSSASELTPLFAPPIEETEIVTEADPELLLDGTQEIIVEEVVTESELSQSGTEPVSPKTTRPITSTKTVVATTSPLATTSSKSQFLTASTTSPTRRAASAATWRLPASTKSVAVTDLTIAAVRQAWQAALRSQESAGDLSTIQLTHPATASKTSQQQPVPLALILASLAQPTFIDRAYIDRFTQTLGPRYALLVFYTHSKRFPILIIENSDPDAAQSFLQLWEKETLRTDLAPLSAPVSTAPFLRGYFVTKQTPSLTYRIAYRQDNTKLIWLLYNGSVVFSTTIAGLEQLPQIIPTP